MIAAATADVASLSRRCEQESRRPRMMTVLGYLVEARAIVSPGAYGSVVP